MSNLMKDHKSGDIMENQVFDWKLDYGNDQHQGARPTQQDYFASFEPKMTIVRSTKGFMAVVADGMGGHAGGGNASVIAVTKFIEEYKKRQEKDETIPDALQRALLQANAAVVAANEHAGEGSDMGTTLVACVLQANKLYWVSVGDSCLFLYRGGKLKKINQEHSYGNELKLKLKAGQITQAEANSESKKRNMLTSYLGIERIPKVDCPSMPTEIMPGDKVLLCTDGLVNAMSDAEIEFALQEEKNAQEKCEFLTQQALKKQMPRQDNITTVLLEMNPKPVEPAAAAPRSNTLKIAAIITGVLFALVLLIGGVLYGGKLKETIMSVFTPEKTPAPAITATATPQVTAAPVATFTPTHEATLTVIPEATPTETAAISPSPTLVPASMTPDPGLGHIPFEQWQQTDPDIVIKIQVVLSHLKDLRGRILYEGGFDNDAGIRTQTALRAFQTTKELTPSGFLDHDTYRVLEPYFKTFSTQIEYAIAEFRRTRPYSTPTPAVAPE